MTTDTLRQVFGTLRSPNGSAYPNKSLKWFRERRAVAVQGSSVVLDEPFIVATDAGGEIDIDVMAGAYLVLAPLSDADRYFRVVVPDQAGPFDISSLIEGPTVEPDDLTQFESLVSKAKAWANAPEDSAVEGGEFSAKHYAIKSQNALDISITKAAEWAENEEDVEVEAGRYSARHWAAKSAQEKTLAQTAASVATASREAIAELVELSWSPREFLKDGGAGVYLMPLDPVAGNVWTDTARTTAATAAGQRVASARLVTETGAFLYAEQAALGDRPFLSRNPAGSIRNRINNSAATGAVVGAPGTLPSTWGVTGGTITREIVATGLTAEGEEYIDIRLTGSPGASGIIQLGGNTDTIVLAGETLCWSVKVARIAGDATNIDYARLQMTWRNSGGSFISGAFDDTGNIVDFKNETTLAVRQMVATAPALSAFVLPQIRLSCTGAIDITLRISAGQVEEGIARSGWQRVAPVSGLANNTFVDVSEAGKPSIWGLYRSNSSDSLPVTLAGYGSNASVLRAELDLQSITEGVTVGAGAYQVLGAVGSRIIALSIVSRALTDGEAELSDVWLLQRRGLNAAFVLTPIPNGPVRLDDMGFLPENGDVRDMIATAFSLGRSNTVVIPYNVAPWVSFGTLTLAADQRLVFEAGAVLDQRHAAAPGILMSGDRSALIGAKITSTIYPYQTLAAVSATAAATNSHRRRGINVTGADCVIEDLDLEYAAHGVTGTGARMKLSIKRAQYLRSSEGWAAAVNMRPGSDYSVIEVGRIMDCDRAMEPEDGASHIRFIGKPGVLERIESRWFDCTATQAETFTISAHSHSGPENYLPDRGRDL
ncbi:hypothetical protein [Pseudorhodobacter sp.]|uniref:hypothetical protein n=1 Tax=Pseudorhodobacter sp. TaxID=1934400 RepID=UPI002AFE26A6|nr:hypothetical protein [Pseudorhodobacter sp.]